MPPLDVPSISPLFLSEWGMSGKAATCMTLYHLQQKCLKRDCSPVVILSQYFYLQKTTLLTKLYYIKQGDVSAKYVRVMTI